MIQLIFANGQPNSSLEIGDFVFFVSNISTATGDFGQSNTTSDEDGVSNYIYIGNVVSIQTNNSPSQMVNQALTTNSTFTVFVENFPQGVIIPPGDTNIPTMNDFIFFSKDNRVNTSSALGYYSETKMMNNSSKKAELFAVSCDVTESSK